LLSCCYTPFKTTLDKSHSQPPRRRRHPRECSCARAARWAEMKMMRIPDHCPTQPETRLQGRARQPQQWNHQIESIPAPPPSRPHLPSSCSARWSLNTTKRGQVDKKTVVISEHHRKRRKFWHTTRSRHVPTQAAPTATTATRPKCTESMIMTLRRL